MNYIFLEDVVHTFPLEEVHHAVAPNLADILQPFNVRVSSVLAGPLAPEIPATHVDSGTPDIGFRHVGSFHCFESGIVNWQKGLQSPTQSFHQTSMLCPATW